MAIEGDPVTSDDSTDRKVSFDWLEFVDSTNASETPSIGGDAVVMSFIDAPVVEEGVVLRRVNRKRLKLVLFAVVVDSVSFNSHAEEERKENWNHINSP